MTPEVPTPDPLPLPAPVWLLHGLLLLTFFLHLVAMNLVLGGSTLAALARLRAWRTGDSRYAELARRWAQALPVLFAATVTLGVAALLFLQVLYGRVFFASSVVMAWAWASVFPLLILAYYGAYVLALRSEALHGWSVLLAGAVAVVLMGVAFIYTNNMSLMLRPAELVARYQKDARGWHLAFGDAALVPRFLHMLLGAVAVAGLTTALVGASRRSRAPAFADWAVRHGSVWFVAVTAVNLLVGFWWLGVLPRPTLARLVGGSDPAAAAVLGVGVAAGLAAVAVMIGGVASPRPARFVLGGSAAAVLSLASMILTRDQVRRAALEAAGVAPVTWVVPQGGAIAIFVLLLLTAVATVVWMIARLARGPGSAEAPSR